MADGEQDRGAFYGTPSYGVDASHRILLPAQWRPKDTDSPFILIPWPVPLPKYILVLTPTRWAQLQERLTSQISLGDEEGADMERMIFGSAEEVRLDRQGRLCLGEKFRARFRIGEKATLVGRGAKFEIWDAETYTAHEAVREAKRAEMLAEKLSKTFL